ncbi:DUF418 domain-containing protein [Runella slithyformis]|uniref:DUF418 domain-containing protein n=1 Tax=Runella slithyformis (strain ATCC 29530 / DSM 19594 / LMG 11500 / NCIMB 11436 / LSU 4) TaxID=761193 RepID=A0A7U3ZPS0_RUNSL|nr:DUF418 domain-containing protein [Runella slithyformis]AEI51068.1 hypothetical protein Runsl_4750 [Runella slithyformis DSM 19594]
MKKRIIGFDLARAYAVFGMFIVNFNTVFGSHTDHNGVSGFLNAFNGNSSTLFVMLAGMGVSLLTNRNDYSLEERNTLKRIVTKRSWFLFGLGIAFYFWWPADILHFYGGYMHIAVLFLFLPQKYYLYAAFSAIVIFHLLLAMIPYETGWNFNTLMYTDFWTVPGFIRNTFYNGWNSIFPWIAYFFLGMYVGRMDWKENKTPKIVLVTGVSVYIFTVVLQFFATDITNDKDVLHYLTADYLPPFLPFMVGTASFGLIVISLFIFIGNAFGQTALAKLLASTGQMTLTHYILHLTLGFFMLSLVTGKTLSHEMLNEAPTHPLIILTFAIVYFLLSCSFSDLWTKKYKNGPLEMVMRKLAG